MVQMVCYIVYCWQLGRGGGGAVQSVHDNRWKSNLCVSINQRLPLVLNLLTASFYRLDSHVIG